MTAQRKPKPLTRAQIREGLDQIPMDTLLLGTAVKQAGASLTPKQREFARLVALGESKAGAYRKSYNSKGKPNTQRVEAHKISRNPNVANMVEAFAEAKRFAESHTPAQLRAFVVQQLAYHAANAERDSDKLRALQLLGTVHEVAAYTARSEQVVVKASGDIRARIADKLKLIGASTTIENNAMQDDAQDADSLLQELTATPIESQDADPTPPGAPLIEGVFGGEGMHNIPHSQISDLEKSIIPDMQSDSFLDSEVPSKEILASSVVVSSLSTDNEPSVGPDSGLEKHAAG